MARYQPKSNSITEYRTAREWFDVKGDGDDVFLYSAIFCFSHTCCYCAKDQEKGLWSFDFEGRLPRIVFCKDHEEIAAADYLLVCALLNAKK